MPIDAILRLSKIKKLLYVCYYLERLKLQSEDNYEVA